MNLENNIKNTVYISIIEEQNKVEVTGCVYIYPSDSNQNNESSSTLSQNNELSQDVILKLTNFSSADGLPFCEIEKSLEKEIYKKGGFLNKQGEYIFPKTDCRTVEQAVNCIQKIF